MRSFCKGIRWNIEIFLRISTINTKFLCFFKIIHFMPFLFQKHIYLYIFLSFVWFLKGVLYVSMCVSLNLREGPGHTPEFVPKTMCRAKYKLWYYFFFKFGAFFFLNIMIDCGFIVLKWRIKSAFFKDWGLLYLVPIKCNIRSLTRTGFFFSNIASTFFCAIFVIDTIDKPIKRQNILV